MGAFDPSVASGAADEVPFLGPIIGHSSACVKLWHVFFFYPHHRHCVVFLVLLNISYLVRFFGFLRAASPSPLFFLGGVRGLPPHRMQNPHVPESEEQQQQAPKTWDVSCNQCQEQHQNRMRVCTLFTDFSRGVCYRVCFYTRYAVKDERRVWPVQQYRLASGRDAFYKGLVSLHDDEEKRTKGWIERKLAPTYDPAMEVGLRGRRENRPACGQRLPCGCAGLPRSLS